MQRSEERDTLPTAHPPASEHRPEKQYFCRYLNNETSYLPHPPTTFAHLAEPSVFMKSLSCIGVSRSLARAPEPSRPTHGHAVAPDGPCHPPRRRRMTPWDAGMDSDASQTRPIAASRMGGTMEPRIARCTGTVTSRSPSPRPIRTAARPISPNGTCTVLSGTMRSSA